VFGGASRWFWSSTTSLWGDRHSWTVGFGGLVGDISGVKSDQYFVRAVRGGT